MESINRNYSKIKHKFPNVFESLIRASLERRQLLQGSFDTNSSHLISYFDESGMEMEEHDILSILNKSNYKFFRTPEIEFSSKGINIDFFTRFNPDASTGHYTSKIFGRKRSETILHSRIIAQYLLNMLTKVPLKNFCLWDVLGREKDVKVGYNNGDEVESRVVLNTEEPIMLLLSYFSRLITKALESDIECRFPLKGEFNNRKSNSILNKHRFYDFYIATDWKKFDSQCKPEFIKVASSILLSGLKRDKFHDRIKYFITSSLITKYICVPPGLVYECNKGVPSGHPFTSLITSYINIIY